MRRLPVYLVLDTSGSMTGEPIESVKNGVQVLLSTLRQDPHALETVYLSIISFNSRAEQVLPLTELSAVQLPNLVAQGTTSMGDALSLLSSKAESEVVRTSESTKGDWKPLVFLMTDGQPTDDMTAGLARFKQQKWGMVIACAAGSGANTSVLQQITDVVVSLETTDSNSIKAFFKWVSASISSGSQKVETTGREVGGMNELPPPPPEVNVVI
jgi:uncharacterized protein YegL